MSENRQFADPAFEHKVRVSAYFLWEDAGRPWGREKEFWYTAFDRCLREQEAGDWLRGPPPEASRLS